LRYSNFAINPRIHFLMYGIIRLCFEHQ